MNRALAKTTFLTALASFVGFLMLDLARPGFVSRYASVHWFLMAALASGIWWAASGASVGRERRLGQAVAVSGVSVLAVMASWQLREGLGEHVMLVVVLSAAAPWFILNLLRRYD